MVRQRLWSQDEHNAVSPVRQNVKAQRLAAPGRNCLTLREACSSTVAIPSQVPNQSDAARTSVPSVEQKAGAANTHTRRTGNVSKCSMVPRPISPLTMSEPRPTAQPMQITNGIGWT